jgi:hypothetical protein
MTFSSPHIGYSGKGTSCKPTVAAIWSQPRDLYVKGIKESLNLHEADGLSAPVLCAIKETFSISPPCSDLLKYLEKILLFFIVLYLK